DARARAGRSPVAYRVARLVRRAARDVRTRSNHQDPRRARAQRPPAPAVEERRCVVIGVPFDNNDLECLSAISEVMVDLVAHRDPLLIELAEQYRTTPALAD